VTDSSAGSVDVPPTPHDAGEPVVAADRGARSPASEHQDPPSAVDPVTGPVTGSVAEHTAAFVEPADDPADSADSADPDDAADSAVTPPVAPAVMGDFRMALVSSVSVDLPNQHPSVVLRESESPRRQLTFSIAFQDAVVLSHALRRIPTPRPLTHELLAGILQRFDIDVVAVRLVGRKGSVYFAELDLMGRNGRSVQSCRPSDGLTVALLQPVPVPILIDRRLFEVVGDVDPPGPSG
jgi:uncharacterized protein